MRPSSSDSPCFSRSGLARPGVGIECGHAELAQFRARELEQTRDFIRWAGCYEAKLERETRYRQLVYEHLRELRRQSGLGVLELTPAAA